MSTPTYYIDNDPETYGESTPRQIAWVQARERELCAERGIPVGEYNRGDLRNSELEFHPDTAAIFEQALGECPDEAELLGREAYRPPTGRDTYDPGREPNTLAYYDAMIRERSAEVASYIRNNVDAARPHVSPMACVQLAKLLARVEEAHDYRAAFAHGLAVGERKGRVPLAARAARAADGSDTAANLLLAAADDAGIDPDHHGDWPDLARAVTEKGGGE